MLDLLHCSPLNVSAAARSAPAFGCCVHGDAASWISVTGFFTRSGAATLLWLKEKPREGREMCLQSFQKTLGLVND
jgi:hypothetical protein